MKIKATLKAFALAALLAIAANANVFAQEEQPKERPRTVGQQEQNSSQPKDDEVLVTDAKSDTAPQDTPATAQADRREQLSEEEAAVLPYYNNYLSTYYLGPEDVISVTDF